jgi:hypothetical protein
MLHFFQLEILVLICITSSLVMVITDALKSHVSSSEHGTRFFSTRHQSKGSNRLTRSSRRFNVDRNVDRRIRSDFARSTVTDSAETDSSEKEYLSYTVEQVLDSLSQTDKGASASKQLQKKVNAWIELKSEEYKQSLSALNKQLGRVVDNSAVNNTSTSSLTGLLKPPVTVLDDENIYGNYDVTYVSTLKAAKQEGNPAGGNFRGTFGRFIYENEGLYQHILREDDLEKEKMMEKEKGKEMEIGMNKNENDEKNNSEGSMTQDGGTGEQGMINVSRNVMNSEIEVEVGAKTEEKQSRIIVVNYICGKLFRFITVSVILKGILEKITENDRLSLTQKFGTVLSPGTIRADFDSPLITIGGVGIRIGPNSNVVLDTPYLDGKIRLGVGARGSSFIFKRTLDENANKWKIDIRRKALPAKQAGFFLFFLGTSLFNLFSNCRNIYLSFFKNSIAISTILFGLILFLTSGGIRVQDNLKLEKK